MEAVPGGSLTRMIYKFGPLSDYPKLLSGYCCQVLLLLLLPLLLVLSLLVLLLLLLFACSFTFLFYLLLASL